MRTFRIGWTEVRWVIRPGSLQPLVVEREATISEAFAGALVTRLIERAVEGDYQVSIHDAGEVRLSSNVTLAGPRLLASYVPALRCNVCSGESRGPIGAGSEWRTSFNHRANCPALTEVDA